ncbi:serine--tRNA ligase [Roseiterribacter gracilis]|uniref:Serine--tRNA ligase n=1 Tax=Roseiterribacter gracilis TaxID=2812848 RepID=A0A8S8XAW9_9PROT|nr:serine--tRNA ligase [Rhodospirillales bacterium TMPK1]
MFDLRAIRDNPDEFDRGLARRGLTGMADEVLNLDSERRRIQTETQEAQQRRNALSKEIGAAKSRGEKADDMIAEVGELKMRLPALEDRQRTLDERMELLLAGMPNLPAADVPEGEDETHNVVQSYWPGPNPVDPATAAGAKDHVELGERLGMSAEDGAKLSGARFTVLRGPLARLERALGQFMLDLQTTRFGYEEVAPPILVRGAALFGTSQLPKFAEDLFHTTDDRWLIPTAEVPLTNLVREQIVDADRLPLRMTALTPCFRAEAGAAGKDTRGMIRQHQFWKVELVSVTTPDESNDEHERMTQAAETVLRELELPFRRVLLCAGDMGFSARKTYDLEVWLPGQAAYREISSCSNCGDFQARRMDARFRAKGSTDSPRFVHTLNGSGLAVGRTLIAVLENHQQPDGSIAIPNALRPYLGGVDRITP